MKLAAISHLASPGAPTGAERCLAEITTAMSGAGHEVEIAVPGPWCLGESVEAAGCRVVEIGNRACWLVQAGEQPWLAQAARYLRYRFPDPGFRRLQVWLDRFWPDVVHVNCLPQIRGAEAARSLGLPVVWHVHEILPVSRRRRWFAGKLRRNAHRIIAVSHAVADWIRAEGLGARCTVVRNGCTLLPGARDVTGARRRLQLPENGVMVGYFAQIVGHKGYPDLVRAVAMVMAEHPDLHLVIAGDGPEREIARLRRMTDEAPRPGHVHVFPPVDDVTDLLTAVDMVAVPSSWPDPLPRTVMEAMAAGLPVVAYHTGGVPEMVANGETGLLVEPGDEAGLAIAIGALAGDPGLRSDMAAAARKRAAAEFSLERHLELMERVFTEVAAGDGTGAERQLDIR